MQENYIKITNAVYKLLDVLPDGEPLKNRSKEKALDVLADLTVGKKEHALENIQILKQYLEIIKGQGWIDGMNVLILLKEYEQIKSQISINTLQISPKLEIQKIKPEIVEKKAEREEVFSSRQSQIIKILKNNKSAQVVDLIKELPNITKRTVRRDLDHLLKKGKIVRSGKFNQIFYQIS